MPDPERVVAGLWAGLTGVRDDPSLAAVSVTGTDPALPSVFRVGTAAAACVATATLAAAVFAAERAGGFGAEPPPVRVDVRASAAAFRSERYLRVGDRSATLWEPLSGDYPTADGWVRVHANFAHHARAACRALGVDLDRDALGRALRRWRSVEAEEAVLAAGGAAGALRTRAAWTAHPQHAVLAARPIVGVEPIAGAPEDGRRAGRPAGSRMGRAGRPLAGLRVLDLTRVIAGPVAGRVLTSWGADVLAVRAPHLPTVPWLDVDTGFGKRARLLDLRAGADREAFAGLVRRSDVVVRSYRPGALDGLGFGAAELATLRPGLGVVSVSAYGDAGPWAGRRGFDSLVQLVTGLAEEERRAVGADRPVPLPAQALDHAAGWLAAAGAIEAARRSRRDGGSWHARVTLAGVADWLDGLGRVEPAPAGGQVPDPGRDDVTDLLATMRATSGEPLSYVRPPGTIGGVAPSWESPTPFGVPAL